MHREAFLPTHVCISCDFFYLKVLFFLYYISVQIDTFSTEILTITDTRTKADVLHCMTNTSSRPPQHHGNLHLVHEYPHWDLCFLTTRIICLALHRTSVWLWIHTTVYMYAHLLTLSLVNGFL